MMLRCWFTLAWIAALTALLITARGGERRQGDWRFASRETEVLAFLFVVLWASVLRLTWLSEVPPSLLSDERMFAIETHWRPETVGDTNGDSLMRSWPCGWCPYIFGWGHNGFPNLSYFLHWLPWMVTRESGIVALRAGCGVFGIVSVIILYFFVRRWWGAVAASVAAIIGAGIEEHIAWSRHAMNNIDMAVIGAWNLAAIAYLLDTGSARAWVSVGMSMGFGWYVYNGAKLSTVLVPVLLIATWQHVSWRRIGWGFAAFVLVVAPLVPDIYTDWATWRLHHVNKVNYAIPLNLLWQGAWNDLGIFLRGNWDESVRMFRYTPWLVRAVWAGCIAALVHWTIRRRDYRYQIVLLWFLITGVIGSLGIDWRNSRLFPIWPALAILPALAWVEVSRFLPRTAALVVALVMLLGLQTEAVRAYFVDRQAWDRTITHALCSVAYDGDVESVAILGEEKWGVRSCWESCAIPTAKWPRIVAPEEAQVWIIFPDAIDTVQVHPGQWIDTIRAPAEAHAPRSDAKAELYVLRRK